jgi:dihydroorotate dehydrogenase
MYRLLKFFLFRIDPEKAHYITMWWFMALLKVPGVKTLMKSLFSTAHPSLERTVAGMKFSNPVGLAAGFDKNGLFLLAMATLGFSHIEVGTITPRPQDGNPKPRLFRLIKSRALINRMGFNNDGVEVLAERLSKKRPKGLIVGANIGKNKDTPNEDAAYDYLICFSRLYDLVDYFTVNVSSPNTPGLRSLQDKEPLLELLTALQENNPDAKPVFLKIAPDLTSQQLDEIVEIVLETEITGVIATNTTITRDGLKESKEMITSIGAGGMSGAPILNMSTSVVRYLKEKSNGQFVIIGVGGIEDYTSAKQHLDAGADLIQVYSGFIYTGPGLVKGILKGVMRKAESIVHRAQSA